MRLPASKRGELLWRWGDLVTRDAAIVAVTKSHAAFSQAGRAWPLAEVFDGTLNLEGYSVEGVNGAELRLSSLFRHLPVAALRAKFEGALKPTRKRRHA